jgi:peptidoglycan/xylan/chitin deacetylase (PgdA/CDA1 family)
MGAWAGSEDTGALPSRRRRRIRAHRGRGVPLIACAALALLAAAVWLGPRAGALPHRVATRSSRVHLAAGAPPRAVASCQRRAHPAVAQARGTGGAHRRPRVPADAGPTGFAVGGSPARPVAPAPSFDPFAHVLVLEYHDVVPAACAQDAEEIPVAAFARQMAELHASHVPVVTARTLALWLEAGVTLPRQVVVLTFDDGYEGVYLYAFPILARDHLPFTVFLIGHDVRRSGPPVPSGLARLTVAEIRTMEASGLVDVESHTYNLHGNVPCPYDCASAPVIARDLAHNDALILRWTGRRPVAFAYPGGRLSPAGLREAVDHYAIAFIGMRVPPQALWAADSRWLVPRYFVFPRTNVAGVLRAQRDGWHWTTEVPDFFLNPAALRERLLLAARALRARTAPAG